MKFPEDWTEELARKPICGVLAVAVIANTTFAKATLAIKSNMLPQQKRHGGKTYHTQRLGALDQLGVEYKDQIWDLTLNQFITKHAKPNTLYMINITGHVVLYKNDLILDQRGVISWTDFPNKRKKIKNVTRIISKWYVK